MSTDSMTRREREDLAAWLERISTMTQGYADKLDPKRTGKGDLVRKLDALTHLARQAAGYAACE